MCKTLEECVTLFQSKYYIDQICDSSIVLMLSLLFSSEQTLYSVFWTLISFVRFYISFHRRCSIKKVFLKTLQNSQENTCSRFSFWIIMLQALGNFIKKGTPAPVFSCEFFEIFKNIYFTEHLRMTASVSKTMKMK